MERGLGQAKGGGKWLHSWPPALLEVFVTGPEAILFLPALKTSRIQRANALCFQPRFWGDLAKDLKVSVGEEDSYPFLFVEIRIAAPPCEKKSALFRG